MISDQKQAVQLLRAGYSETVITPPVGFNISGPEHSQRQAKNIADDLLGRVLLLEAGGVRAAIVTLDVWGISEEFASALIERVSAAADIDTALVWIGVSGNASSPPLWESDQAEYIEYAAYVPQQIGGVAALAADRMQDAELGFTSAFLPDLATSIRGRQHEIDETVPIMIVDGVSGPIARVFGFGCPGSVVGAEPAVWTSDYPGYACWALSQASDGAGCIFIRGPAHDVSPFDWYNDNPAPGHSDRTQADVQALGWLLATQVGIATQGVLLRRNVEIKPVGTTGSLPELGRTKSIAIADGLFDSFFSPLTTEFGVELREQTPDQTVFACANMGGLSFQDPAPYIDTRAAAERHRAR